MSTNSNNGNKGCFKGCLVIIAIFIAGIVILGLFIAFKGDDILQMLMRQTKEGITYLLTEDHTDKEKAAFSAVFTDFLDDLQEGGFQQGVQRNREAVSKLQEIIEDKRITRLEGQQWIEVYKNQ
jgi:hypothetical protein